MMMLSSIVLKSYILGDAGKYVSASIIKCFKNILVHETYPYQNKLWCYYIIRGLADRGWGEGGGEMKGDRANAIARIKSMFVLKKAKRERKKRRFRLSLNLL